MAAHVLAGTYDGNLYGWEVQRGEKDVEEGAELPMPLRIGTEAHVGSVKSIAVHRVKRGHMIVTGGEDENISCAGALCRRVGRAAPDRSPRCVLLRRSPPRSLFSLDRLRQVGTLNQHSGSINTFDFFGNSHMLSGGDDAQVAIWRTSDWECVHVLAGHKYATQPDPWAAWRARVAGSRRDRRPHALTHAARRRGPVRSVAVHPSGKLALSTSDDSTLRMWDLVQGRAAYIKRLALPAELVAWAPDGMQSVGAPPAAPGEGGHTLTVPVAALPLSAGTRSTSTGYRTRRCEPGSASPPLPPGTVITRAAGPAA